MKRLLSLLLIFGLLLSFAEFFPQIGVNAASTENGYLLHQFAYKMNTTAPIGADGILFSPGGENFNPIDLVKYGYSVDPDLNTVGLQFDIYATGDNGAVSFLESGQLGGQIELASGGIYDCEEVSRRLNGITFKRNEWKRVVVSLSTFTNYTNTQGDAQFDPTRLNWFRVYAQVPAKEDLAGQVMSIKMCNFCLVDMTKEALSEEEFPVGDGTFIPEKPQWELVEFADGFVDTTPTVAGYNVKTYMEEHGLSAIDPQTGLEDYTVIFESLMGGLQQAGGGTLFVPAGEYAFRQNLMIPNGVNIMGEWKQPDESSNIEGTIFKIYHGRDMSDGFSFITMDHHTLIENVVFWYPEQMASNPSIYPPTISATHYAYIKNATFVNSYVAIKFKGGGCPNIYNIYGTPLSVGVDVDNISDIARMEEIHFAADYWANSGLPGSPTSEYEREALEEQLYHYAIGISLRRLDFSPCNFVDICGYNMGVYFDTSLIRENYFPNGLCHGMRLTGCKYGMVVYGISSMGMMVSDTVIEGCEIGVYMPSSNVGGGSLKLYNVDISAETAVSHAGIVRVQLVECTIRKGAVLLENGTLMVANTRFMTSAPHVILSYNACGAVLVGNTNKNGGEIVVDNRGRSPLAYDKTPMAIDEVASITAEEAAPQTKGPAVDNLFVADSLDATGMTDVTEDLQTILTLAGKAGGGLVYLPAGKYRIEGSVTIPTGVELRGSQDLGLNPQYKGTVLQLYRKGDEQSQATFNMQAGSGLRGIVAHYPEQTTHRINADGTYVFDFVSYPYLVRGQGRDIYVISVSVQNGWNGIDFATNRCNYHYIDGVGGHFYNRGIVVGAGSFGGVIRNYHFNYNAIYQAYNSLWGSWPSLGEKVMTEHFLLPMHKQFNTHAVALTLGNVSEQLVYDSFNYAGYAAVQFVEENGEAANARFIGFMADHTTICVDAYAFENVSFYGTILCGFDRYNVSGQEPYDIWMHDGAEGKLVFTNLCVFGENPAAAACVEDGVLQLNNVQLSLPYCNLLKMGEKGTAQVNATSWDMGGNPPIAAGNTSGVFWNGAFYVSEAASTENIGSFTNALLRLSYHSMPENVLLTDDSELVFSESFDSYELTNNSLFRVDNERYGSIHRGAVRVRMDSTLLANGIKTGQDPKSALPFALDAGSSDDLYRMEWRINVAEMRETDESEILLFLSNSEAKRQNVFTVQRDGKLLDQTGTAIATMKMKTDYRIAVEVDARNAENKTVTLYLLNDDSRVLAKGKTTAMDDIFQGENTVTGFWLSAMAYPIDAPETKTEFTVDYFYISKSEQSSIGRNVDPNSALVGDVNSDEKVDSTDARLILQYTVNKIDDTAISVDVADVNSDGKVDSTDARIVLQYAVKKIDKFPADD